ncbi:MAG: HD domain-containing protein [Planctomycetota bacterium]
MIQWIDRVYGLVAIQNPSLENLIQSPTMTRLGGVKQSGPSALVFPFKTVSRLEHSLGVYVLLQRLGAAQKECVAGLLHDISHTAFSHAIDFLITSDEQNHHEHLKAEFLHRPDIVKALEKIGYEPNDFEDDSKYRLLEQPLPGLCADRIDYFLRDGLACGEIGQPFVTSFLSQLVVAEGEIAMADLGVARMAVDLFARMNSHWWASDSEAFIYNQFADILRQAMAAGVITDADLLTSDDEVIQRIESTGDASLKAQLEAIRSFCPSDLGGFVPKVIPKHRWIDPPVWKNGKLGPFSEWN